MQWLGIVLYFVCSTWVCHGCLTNPFRTPVEDGPDPERINGVTQGFLIQNFNGNSERSALASRHGRIVNSEVLVNGKDRQNYHDPRQHTTGPTIRHEGEHRLSVDLTRFRNETTRSSLTVRNGGQENELVTMTAYDSNGQPIPIDPSEFYLNGGAARQIPLTYSRKTRSSQFENQNPELITIQARSRRDSVKRSFYFKDSQYNELEPFCFDKDVSGTCRYRSDPEDCFRWDWTAYATILNRGGGSQKITSIPEGLYLIPGDHGRVRVYLKVSCCTPVVQFISSDPYNHPVSCVVDVRELQILHPGEIAGIVIAVIVLLIIIIAVIVFCARKRGKETISVGMLPHRARSREVISRQ